MANRWKITAIIFIISFIVETLLFIYLISLGVNEVNKKSECQVNVCKDYDAFYYDTNSQICYCYKDNEIKYQEFIK